MPKPRAMIILVNDMKKKHRDIIVENQAFGYIITRYGKELYIKIYQNKKIVYNTTWRTTREITPKDIEELIKENNLLDIGVEK